MKSDTVNANRFGSGEVQARAVRAWWWRKHRYVLNAVAFALADTLAVGVAGLATNTHEHIIAIMVAMWLVLSQALRLYPAWVLGRHHELERIAGVAIVTSLGLSALDHTTILHGFLLATIALANSMGLRALLREILATQHAWGAPTLLVGSSAVARAFTKHLAKEPALGFQPVAHLELEQTGGTPGVAGLSHVISLDAGIACGIQAVLVVGSDARAARAIIEEASLRLPIVVVAFDPASLEAGAASVSRLAETTSIEWTNRTSHLEVRFLKRAFDLFVLFATLPLWLPLLMLGMLLAGWPLRPAFVGEKRTGLRERTFSLLHFRPTSAIRAFGHLGFAGIANLLNVLRGDLTLVGPRPLPPSITERMPNDVRQWRAQSTPGLTGQYQVVYTQPGMVHMLRHDLSYLRHWSLSLDMIILARAVLRGLRRRTQVLEQYLGNKNLS